MVLYPYRRRQFFIKKEFQSKFIMLYTLMLVLLAGLTTWILSLKINKALEWHIYSSHLKVERTGEFISGLLFETNMIAIVAIIGMVTVLSMYVVNRLNRHFSRMCQIIDGLSAWRFDHSRQTRSKFHEISLLIEMVENLKTATEQRHARMQHALATVEKACAGTPDKDELQNSRNLLLKELSQVSLPEE